MGKCRDAPPPLKNQAGKQSPRRSCEMFGLLDGGLPPGEWKFLEGFVSSLVVDEFGAPARKIYKSSIEG